MEGVKEPHPGTGGGGGDGGGGWGGGGGGDLGNSGFWQVDYHWVLMNLENRCSTEIVKMRAGIYSTIVRTLDCKVVRRNE